MPHGHKQGYLYNSCNLTLPHWVLLYGCCSANIACMSITYSESWYTSIKTIIIILFKLFLGEKRSLFCFVFLKKVSIDGLQLLFSRI